MNKLLFSTPNVTDTRDSDVEGLGSLRWVGDRCYKWVCNTNTSVTFSAGQVVGHTVGTGGTVTHYVTKPATGSLNLIAGVCVSTLAANTGTNPKCYGWVQVFGHCTTASVMQSLSGGSSIAAGGSLIPANAQTYFVHGAAEGTAPLTFRGAIALEAVNKSTLTDAQTEANKAVFVRCI